ncbi:hypothetical protein KXS11_09500 [Plantibacter flavus]|uniref:hypothetical protein n=1 Tax=Plantibacter flavus TaxID=150123 RepID=UPI003F150B77
MQTNSSILRRLTTASAIYGTIVYAGLIGASSVHDDDDVEDVLITSLLTLIVFWLAHVYAAALAHHGDDSHEDTVTLGTSLRHGFRESSGMLLAVVLPTVPLVIGVAGAIDQETAVLGALRVSTLVLFVLGFAAFVVRGYRWWAWFLGGAATAVFGVAIFLLEAGTH